MDFNSNNLTVPRGKVFFAKYLPGTQIPGPFRELGNCPEFTLTREAETLQHFSSQRDLKVLDKTIAISSSLTGAVVTDDVKAENLAYWLMGDVNTLTTTLQAGLIETFLLVKAGDHFQLGRSDANPSGHRKVTITAVTDGAGTPVPWVVNTDYVVNTDLGILDIPAGSGAIGQTVKVTYGVAASSREQIVSGDEQIEGELKFVSFNPVGAQADITCPRALIAPNGDLSLLTDPESTAFQTLPLSITVLKKGILALAYRDGRVLA
ncbi:MAG: hypothetical protein EOS07_21835 [Mesorhizobium sp.]|uniref:phage tail tube protein n=1 Tax=Mesorhizobium sp. TaxID=1871066 RepID=UPI000FE45FDA|nr:hypothetical protein [Mesorhizobium sp.]RWO06284.1 MAG: hypothetical protein EOS07_21835 [Mesorhizobium sp.]RWP29858.1 MAG: hypothetical protein EOR03_25710 [Mesorhizobium sp.]RWP69574.1 MAG: hypothetical protein EOR07_03350 [Mesorhizobium sp.]